MKKIRPLLWAALLLLLVFGGSACQVREKGRKPSTDWSRSLPLGVYVRGDIDMVVNPDGKLVHLVWLKEGEEGNTVHYMQVDETAVTLLARDLDLPNAQLRLPQILPTAGDKLHLLWLGRSDGQAEWGMQYVQIDETGELIGEIKQLADNTDDVVQFSKVVNGRGEMFVAWEAAADGAIYGSQIASDGTILQEAVRLVDQGSRPSLAVDSENLYMTWFDGTELLMAAWPQGEFALHDGVSLTSIPASRGSKIDGPELGVEGEWAYVIWSVFNNTGLEAGTAATEYIAFPKDNPQRINPQRCIYLA